MFGPFATAIRRIPFTRCRYCRTPPAHRCPQQRQQRQRVTEGTAMAQEWANNLPHNRPIKEIQSDN